MTSKSHSIGSNVRLAHQHAELDWSTKYKFPTEYILVQSLVPESSNKLIPLRPYFPPLTDIQLVGMAHRQQKSGPQDNIATSNPLWKWKK